MEDGVTRCDGIGGRAGRHLLKGFERLCVGLQFEHKSAVVSELR